MAFGYVVSLDVTGRRCLVVGGGELAEARAWSLLHAGAEVTVIAAEPSGGLEALARRGEVALVRRPYRDGDLAGAFLVLVAGGDASLHPAIFAAAERAGVLCNAEDDVAHCHFALPAAVRRGDLAVTVSTGGRAPALAKRLRRRLEAGIGPEYAALVEILAAARADLAPARRSVSFRQWAAAWEDVLDRDEELLALIRRGRDADARHLVRSAFAASLQEALA